MVRFNAVGSGLTLLALVVYPSASWLALITTMPLTTVLIFFIVKNTRKAWDYAVTISFTHLVACIIGE
eukprot:1203961-Pyramimonas_sp.AAC.1